MNKELIIKELDKLYPDAVCELYYNKDYELLLAVMLSAQTTDKKVNSVVKDLFNKYDSLDKLDTIEIEKLENILKPIGLYKNKAKNFKIIVKRIKEDYGFVPNDRSYLESLPGVGRKTTNVVLSNLYGEALFAVDTHVNRVSKVFGIASPLDDVLKVEEKLYKFFPKDKVGKLHHQFVLFGRYICKSQKPECDRCPFKGKCNKTKEKAND